MLLGLSAVIENIKSVLLIVQIGQGSGFMVRSLAAPFKPRFIVAAYIAPVCTDTANI